MKEKILITGGLGYLGGRIAKFLADNSEYWIDLGSRNPNCMLFPWLTNGNVVPVDVMSETNLQKVCSGVNCVIHLAAMNEIDSANNPQQAFVINSLGTLNLLQASLRAGVEKFIYFSTAHVYGAPLTGTISEKTMCRPLHPYAITHKGAEDFVLAAHDKGEIEGIVFRLSNAIGAPLYPEVNRWTLVVNDLCRQAVTKQELVLKSRGLQKRDFISLEDVSRAVNHFLQINKTQYGDGLFNLGGECSLRIIDIAERVANRYKNMFGTEIKIIRPEAQEDFPESDLKYEVEKIKATGFILNKNIDGAIDETLVLCNNNFSQNV